MNHEDPKDTKLHFFVYFVTFVVYLAGIRLSLPPLFVHASRDIHGDA